MLVCLTILDIVTTIDLYNTDAILILEHSFHLAQQDDHQPVSTAAQKYTASNMPARVNTALKNVFKQYSKATEKEKIEMVFNVIAENCISELSTCLHVI